MSRRIVLVALIWSCFIGASFLFSYHSARKVEFRLALQTARSFFDQILITRRWNALHNGVYVPVTESTRPNIYLEDPHRDLHFNATLTLTKLNPAFMTREISTLSEQEKWVRFHITSLNPLRPENRPTPLEREGLVLFDNGTREIGRVMVQDGHRSFFYMGALRTEKSCLSCHAKQGYAQGDIRGGISVTLPFVPKISLVALQIGHVSIWLVGLLGIVLLGGRLEHAYASIKQQSHTDGLTGISNRRSLMERLQNECDRSQREQTPLTVIMGDVDHFKWYNDSYGHREGDECLKKVAHAFQQSLDRPGDFCARYGGEEFVAILANTSLQGGCFVAEKIRNNILGLEIPHEKLKGGVVTMSLGVATSYPDKHALSDEQLVSMADQALYMAKEKGRNRVEAYVPGTSE
ncbi:diguanylate cyclase [Desulfoplanes formicivorans]|uniref:diguanylate cyclase n=1 Tax=Desulfoplanes formicivorans TaxID=1592317 RepID=A0A194AI55_9BACT|nr:diguanylate cyclase [Desulfoplanes formicivorans]